MLASISLSFEDGFSVEFAESLGEGNLLEVRRMELGHYNVIGRELLVEKGYHERRR